MSQRLYYGQPINRAHPLNTGLVSCWKVVPWYASGPRFIDLAAFNHGTLTNGAAWDGAIGKPGGSGSISLLSASSQDVNCGNPTSLQLTGSCSFSYWLKQRGTTGFQSVFSKDKDTGGRAYTNDIDSATTYRFYINGGGNLATNEVRSTTAPTAGVWRHVVSTFSTTGRLRIYVNGVMEDELTGGVTSIPSATANARIGSREFAGNLNYLNGWVDDVRVWNRELSESEASVLFRSTQQQFDPTLSWIERRTVVAVAAAGGNRRRRVICGANR